VRYELRSWDRSISILRFRVGRHSAWVRGAGGLARDRRPRRSPVSFLPPSGPSRLPASRSPSRGRIRPRALVRYLRLDEDPMVHLEHAEEPSRLPGILPLFGLRLLRQDPLGDRRLVICSAAANILKISPVRRGGGGPLGRADRRLPRGEPSPSRTPWRGRSNPISGRAAWGSARRISWKPPASSRRRVVVDALRHASYEEAARALCASCPG